jgi:hypothetical protein
MACQRETRQAPDRQAAGNARRPLRVDASRMCTGRRGLRINLGKGKSETRERRPAKLGSDPPNEVLCWAWQLEWVLQVSVLGDGSGNGERGEALGWAVQKRGQHRHSLPGLSESKDVLARAWEQMMRRKKHRSKVASCESFMRPIWQDPERPGMRDRGRRDGGWWMVDGGCSPLPKSQILNLEAFSEWMFSQFRLCWSVAVLMKPEVV